MYVDTPTGSIYVKVMGAPVKRSQSAHTVLAVHGIFASSACFEPLAALTDMRVLAVDLPGHGQTPHPHGFVPGFSAYVQILQSVVEGLQLKSFTLLGHSMGGGLAVLLATAIPEKVSALILTDSLTGPFRRPLKGVLPTIPLVGDLIFNKLYNRRLFFNYFENDVFLDAKKLNRNQVENYYQCFNANRPQMLQALRATDNPSPILAALPQIQCQTFIIWGEHDRLIPLSVGEYTARHIANAQLHTIPNCGHSPFDEAPEATVKKIRAYIKQNQDSTA